MCFYRGETSTKNIWTKMCDKKVYVYIDIFQGEKSFL